MYNTILVPLDGSKRAEAILPHVEELSRLCGAKVIFLQVVELETAGLGYESIYQGRYQERFELMEEQAESYLAGIKWEFQEKNIEGLSYVVHSRASILQKWP
ncbi:universal stress protein [Thermodesulfobacteriota bacterium]